jgi:hypothetical protein
MTPFYAHLPGFPGFGTGSDIDKVGFWATIGVTTAFATHTLVHLGKKLVGTGGDHAPEGPPARTDEGGEG